MAETDCPFCNPPADRVFYRDAQVIGLWDGFPVTPGHALLIPIRHVSNWFDATADERIALTRSIDVARLAIEARGPIDGYNFGINSGEAAGQTVSHLHMHVIPRRRGDVIDPRGGVRNVIPEVANYLRDRDDRVDRVPYALREQVLITGARDPLLPHLTQHISAARSVSIAVAFTLRSGLEVIQPHMQEFLDRGGSLRLLTGDYLGATDPDALLRLMDLQGDVECRVYETSNSSSPLAFGGSFHPKAYIFDHRDGSGAAIIGSSNLSLTALTHGVEWNYKVLAARDQAGISDVHSAFDALFTSERTTPLTSAWISDYRDRRRAEQPTRAFEDTAANDPPAQVPVPHSIQQEALDALIASRASGKTAGLVVLATGLGKTWLSAFDSAQFKRVLFIAHRDEILGQAQSTFRAIRPHDRLGRYTGTERDPDAVVLFASIQTLSRQQHLERFSPEEFDYIVVDEFHHADARTYRKVLEHFQPEFLLGLTATPERSDGADLLALCDDNLVYRCDLTTGIQKELLCPFRYFGVPDTVDYRNIPWKNKRFDEDELTKAAATQARAENALDHYRRLAGSRTIAFCVSQRHADFMRDFFSGYGITARSVHSGPTSDPRAASLEALRDGKLSVLCAVDMFNEGVDVPELDTVMMLRPTESRIVWLQQFGRGLRRSSPEKRLTVIDYIGNHRSFMLKPQALFGLPAGDREVLNLLTRLQQGDEALPEGCEVTYDLKVIEMFRELLRRGEGALELLTRRYQDFRDTIGVRPTASEMYREGYNPRATRPAHGSWIGFVRAQGGLNQVEASAQESVREFLESLETTEMAKSYKMITLLAMLNRDALPGSIGVNELVSEVLALARLHPRIAEDLGDRAVDATSLRQVLLSQPIPAWCEGRGMGGVSYFSFDNEVFAFRRTVASNLVAAFQEIVREIVDWRLAEYFSRSASTAGEEYVLRVSRSDEQPILFLPNRDSHPGIPEGWTAVRVDNSLYRANFVKVAVNVVQSDESEGNQLPRFLLEWFGSDAGRPGTKHAVALRRDATGWELKPIGSNASGAELYRAYNRADIPPLFGLRHSEYWRQGFIRQGSNTFLLVTLDKSGHEAHFHYRDHFFSATEFQWQSQNKATRAGQAGQSIAEHQARGITVHLFVRAEGKTPAGRGAPFYYLGPVDFRSWDGDKPITVQWVLRNPVPEPLWTELAVPLT